MSHINTVKHGVPNLLLPHFSLSEANLREDSLFNIHCWRQKASAGCGSTQRPCGHWIWGLGNPLWQIILHFVAAKHPLPPFLSMEKEEQCPNLGVLCSTEAMDTKLNLALWACSIESEMVAIVGQLVGTLSNKTKKLLLQCNETQSRHSKTMIFET